MKILKTSEQDLASILNFIASLRSKDADVNAVVRPILDAVRVRGDEAVRELTERFDGVRLNSFQVTPEEIEAAYASIRPEFIQALELAKGNIEIFHRSMVIPKEPIVETMSGVEVWREWRPIERVGLYVPGGTATYPSTVLMTAIPAKLAGCQRVVICTPCDDRGFCNPAVLVAADQCGVSEIYKVGGAQAIAAMAYGTETIPKVYKIFGPGNQYVSTAKMMVFGEVDIDKPAGPSEVQVIADASANPEWVAADLLSQLEHGEDSQALLLTDDLGFAEQVMDAMKLQMKSLSRLSIIEKSFQRSVAVIVNDWDEACELTNEYAPEHLEIIMTSRDQELEILAQINNVGSAFLGPYSSEPLGDYATGSNHTLPTSGYAKMFAPLSTESFGKMIQVQRISKQGIEGLRPIVKCLAQNEGLDAHARAVELRFI